MLAKNIGGFDKIVRIVIGALLILGAVLGYGVWMWIGVVPLATGLLGSCPLYQLVGLNTCPLKK
ncbi:MAG: DUF2892 domain-containing protein [Pelagimonas sp.]